MSGHLHMAQSHSSQEPDPGTGITPFWPKNKINPPLEWELWADQFFLTSDLKERCASRTLLQPPNPVIEEPLPQPEVPWSSETTEQEGQRMLRDDANRKKIEALNAEARRKGPRVAHNVFYHELENSMRARLYLSLGTEGVRRFKTKFPNVKLAETPFRDLYTNLETTFKLEKNLTYERFILFTREQKSNERLTDYHAVLTEQATRCQLGSLEKELVKDLFIARMNSKEYKRNFVPRRKTLMRSWQKRFCLKEG